jgi:hypothetical protein
MAMPAFRMDETPVGMARDWVRAAKLESKGPSKIGWLVAAVVLGAAVVLVAALMRDHPDDPMVRKLVTAPVDDEPLTADERVAIAEARAAFARGEGIPLDQI